MFITCGTSCMNFEVKLVRDECPFLALTAGAGTFTGELFSVTSSKIPAEEENP